MVAEQVCELISISAHQECSTLLRLHDRISLRIVFILLRNLAETRAVRRPLGSAFSHVCACLWATRGFSRWKLIFAIQVWRVTELVTLPSCLRLLEFDNILRNSALDGTRNPSSCGLDLLLTIRVTKSGFTNSDVSLCTNVFQSGFHKKSWNKWIQFWNTTKSRK